MQRIVTVRVRWLQDRFHLELSDEEAVQCMRQLIDVSVSALAPALMDQVHKFAQVRLSCARTCTSYIFVDSS